MDDISTLAGLNSKTPVEIIIVYTEPLSPAETLFQGQPVRQGVHEVIGASWISLLTDK